jgi:hypothetical protein
MTCLAFPVLRRIRAASININLDILDVQIRVRCPDPFSFQLLSRGYGAFLSESNAADLDFTIVHQQDAIYQVLVKGRDPETARNDYELLYLIEKSITIEIQKLRKDLLFLHAGALETGGRACLLVAPSGNGKSTTTWALVNSGFHYMSDELAPVDPGSMQVHPYPHALNLKAAPPEPFMLPAGALYTAYTIHVPTEHFPNEIRRQPAPLAAIFFLTYDPRAREPSLSPISKGEAGARIYSNALNLLAHSRYGLDAAIKVATGGECFELITCDLQKTCDLIESRMRC